MRTSPSRHPDPPSVLEIRRITRTDDVPGRPHSTPRGIPRDIRNLPGNTTCTRTGPASAATSPSSTLLATGPLPPNRLDPGSRSSSSVQHLSLQSVIERVVDHCLSPARTAEPSSYAHLTVAEHCAMNRAAGELRQSWTRFTRHLAADVLEGVPGTCPADPAEFQARRLQLALDQATTLSPTGLAASPIFRAALARDDALAPLRGGVMAWFNVHVEAVERMGARGPVDATESGEATRYLARIAALLQTDLATALQEPALKKLLDALHEDALRHAPSARSASK